MSRESSLNKEPDAVEARQQNLQRCIETLVHACQCSDDNCQPSCQRQKRVFAHAKVCKSKSDCPICKTLLALCCHHAKQCQETKCSVIYCSSIKLKQQQQWHQQQQQLLCRRMAAMKMRNPPAKPVQPAPPVKPAQPAPQMVLMQQQRTVKPSKQQQREALQQLMTALSSPPSHSQQQEILKILKSNPALVVAFLKQRSQNAQNQQQAGDGVENVGVDGEGIVENVGVDGVGIVDVGVDGVGNVDVGLDGVQKPPQ